MNQIIRNRSGSLKPPPRQPATDSPDSVTDWRSLHGDLRRKNGTREKRQDPAIEDHPFHVLLPTHADSLRRFAMKLSANRYRADDLVQTTFLKAWTKRDQFSPGTDLRGWLFTILRNSFYSEIRKFKREVEDVDGKLTAALFQEPTQEHAVELTQLISAIGSLPEIHRQPLIMVGLYGYSQLEAANACGCAVGTIKSRLNRGRDSLNQTFGRERP